MTPVELMTPVEWLEVPGRCVLDPQDILADDGRVLFRGGSTTFASIKEDDCYCVPDGSHDSMQDGYFFFSTSFGHMDGVAECGLDPFDIAVKRGSPA